jgi:hypothetical protein
MIKKNIKKDYDLKKVNTINESLNVSDSEVELEKPEEDNAITYEIKIGGGGESAK